MKTDKRNKLVFNERKNLNDLLKEKILYDNICYKHDLTYSRYCSFCNKDICSKCEKENHTGHNIVNYESLFPDLNEINSAIKNIKQYENIRFANTNTKNKQNATSHVTICTLKSVQKTGAKLFPISRNCRYSV